MSWYCMIGIYILSVAHEKVPGSLAGDAAVLPGRLVAREISQVRRVLSLGAYSHLTIHAKCNSGRFHGCSNFFFNISYFHHLFCTAVLRTLRPTRTYQTPEYMTVSLPYLQTRNYMTVDRRNNILTIVTAHHRHYLTKEMHHCHSCCRCYHC